MTNMQTSTDKTASVEMVAGFICLFVTWRIYISVCAFILHAAVQHHGKTQKATSGQKSKDEINRFLIFFPIFLILSLFWMLA